MHRSQITARAVALVYNLWSWYVRAANPRSPARGIDESTPAAGLHLQAYRRPIRFANPRLRHLRRRGSCCLWADAAAAAPDRFRRQVKGLEFREVAVKTNGANVAHLKRLMLRWWQRNFHLPMPVTTAD